MDTSLRRPRVPAVENGYCTRTTVEDVSLGACERSDRHLIWSVSLKDEQSFGNTLLDPGHPSIPDLILQLTSLLSNKPSDNPNPFDLSRLIGEEVFVLRCFEGGDIEGIESVRTGKRFLLMAWRRKHWPEIYTTVLDKEVSELERRIESLRYSISECRRQIAQAKNTYVNWEE